VSLLLAAALLAGCSKPSEPAPAPTEVARSGAVRAMSHADAATLAARYRDEAVALTGAALSGPPADGLVGCEGKTFAAQTTGDVPVPPDQQATVLAKLREHYQQAGYQVSAAEGGLTATSPDRVVVTAGGNNDAIHIAVATGCYASDEPL
jgi:hypothetical protein